MSSTASPLATSGYRKRAKAASRSPSGAEASTALAVGVATGEGGVTRRNSDSSSRRTLGRMSDHFTGHVGSFRELRLEAPPRTPTSSLCDAMDQPGFIARGWGARCRVGANDACASALGPSTRSDLLAHIAASDAALAFQW